MKKLLAILLCLAIAAPATLQAKKQPEPTVPAYSAEGAGMTTDASTQYKITVLAKKKEQVTDEVLGRCAIHAALFQDVDDRTNAGYSSTPVKKAIMGSPAAEAQYTDFFTPFFENGDCNRYVQLVKDHSVVKADKMWKVSGVVKVNTAQLKKDLTKQGLLKNLGSGW